MADSDRPVRRRLRVLIWCGVALVAGVVTYFLVVGGTYLIAGTVDSFRDSDRAATHAPTITVRPTRTSVPRTSADAPPGTPTTWTRQSETLPATTADTTPSGAPPTSAAATTTSPSSGLPGEPGSGDGGGAWQAVKEAGTFVNTVAGTSALLVSAVTGIVTVRRTAPPAPATSSPKSVSGEATSDERVVRRGRSSRRRPPSRP